MYECIVPLLVGTLSYVYIVILLDELILHIYACVQLY